MGEEDYQKQNRALDAKPVDLVVATPGRLLDFVSNDNLYLGLIELLVLDEADRMLDMGFIPQVRQIVARTPEKIVGKPFLFSATFTPEIAELTTRWAMDPIMVEVEPEKVAADAVDQVVYLVTTAAKYNLLYQLVTQPEVEKVMVFSNRRDRCGGWLIIFTAMVLIVVCCPARSRRISESARWRTSNQASSRCWSRLMWRKRPTY